MIFEWGEGMGLSFRVKVRRGDLGGGNNESRLKRTGGRGEGEGTEIMRSQ